MLGKDNIVKFRRTTDQYGWMSNFSKHPVVFEGKTYPTTEHLYQSQKAVNIEDSEKIRLAKSPKEAAIIGRQLKNIKPYWDTAKFAIMKEIIQIKLDAHPNLKELLLQTGNAIIQEDAPWDSYWGIGKDGKGKNCLGVIWMMLREELKNNTKE